MAENKPPHPPALENAELRHEDSDVDVWAVGKFGIALVLLSIVALGGLFALFRYFEQAAGGPLPPVSRRYQVDARQRPPAPQLEETPILDLARERAAEDKLLNSYGWVDRASGTVRLPIDRAIDLLAERGLPSRAQDPPPASHATVPTASCLGEIVQQPGGPLAGGVK
jgi:hypothetical protein